LVSFFSDAQALSTISRFFFNSDHVLPPPFPMIPLPSRFLISRFQIHKSFFHVLPRSIVDLLFFQLASPLRWSLPVTLIEDGGRRSSFRTSPSHPLLSVRSSSRCFLNTAAQLLLVHAGCAPILQPLRAFSSLPFFPTSAFPSPICLLLRRRDIVDLSSSLNAWSFVRSLFFVSAVRASKSSLRKDPG